MQNNVRMILSLAFVATSLASVQSRAGTIRDDRTDTLYTDIASQPRFAASGCLRILNGSTLFGVASATLIAPHWILTAGHCVIDETGAAGTSWTFQIGGQVVSIPPENVYVPSRYVTSGFDSGYDLAILYLATPVSGVQPASVSPATDEVGKVITTLGYGTTGNGISGNTQAAGTRRAGQNVVDAFSTRLAIPGRSQPPIEAGNQRTLLCDFDSPQRSCSTIGSEVPLNLEYSAAPGDSGGGAFIISSGGVRIVGVVSAGYRPTGLLNGSYGTTAVYTRVSQHIDWMRSVTAGREMPLPTLIVQANQGTLARAAGLSQQRRAAYGQSGYQLSRFIAAGSLAAPVPRPASDRKELKNAPLGGVGGGHFKQAFPLSLRGK